MQHLHAGKIHMPVLRIWQRLMGFTLFGRAEPNNVRSEELAILGSYLENDSLQFRMNIPHHFAMHLRKLGNSPIKRRAGRTYTPIVIGGMITHVAEKVGLDVSQLHPVPCSNLITRNTCTPLAGYMLSTQITSSR